MSLPKGLFDFTPHPLLSGIGPRVLRTGSVRCRQLTEMLPPIDGNVAANWRQRLRPLFETTASLGETRNRHLYLAIILLVCRLRKSCEGCPICQIFSSLAFLVPRPFECSSSISRKPPCHAVNFLPHPMSGFTFRKKQARSPFFTGLRVG